MRHRIEVLLAIAMIAGLAMAAWLLVSGPLAQHFHSRYEVFYAVMTMILVSISIVTGAVVGAWDAAQEAPRRHHHVHVRALFHH
jgi:hypothetical protein